MTWQFTLSGLLIGLLVGMTGMGGGSLLTPILVIFFGFQPTTAVGTDVLHGAIFKSFGAGRLVPELTGGTAWPYEVIGVAFAAVGIGFITQAFVRQKQVDEALARGDYAPFDDRAAIAFAVAGLLLGFATIVLVIAGT